MDQLIFSRKLSFILIFKRPIEICALKTMKLKFYKKNKAEKLNCNKIKMKKIKGLELKLQEN